MKLMSLLDKLGRNYVAGSISMLLAAACGDSTQKNAVPCGSDADCKGDRLCVDGYCEGGEEGDSDGCADSPLTGKYLWDERCHFGTKVPFRNCEGVITFNQISNRECERRECEDYADFKVSYSGLELYLPENGIADIRKMRLLKEFSLSELEPIGGQCYSGEYEWDPDLRDKEANSALCELRIYPKLYVVQVNDRKICVGAYNVILKEVPWPGSPFCDNEMRHFEEQRFDDEC